MVTSVRHPRSAKPFSLCKYGAAYFITIPLFSQNIQSFVDINSLPPSALSVFIEHADSASIRDSHI